MKKRQSGLAPPRRPRIGVVAAFAVVSAFGIGAAAAAPTGSAVSVTGTLGGMGTDPLLDNTGAPKAFTDEINLSGIMQAPDGSLVPGAATKWEIAPDMKSWIWTVRQGVKFHDGSPMTAEDMAWSWKRAILSKESENPYHTTYAPLIEDIYAEGDKVIIKTKNPEPSLPLWWPQYDNQVGYVLSKAQFEKEGIKGIRDKPIGAGTFKLVAKSTSERYVDLEAFEQHYCCVPSVKNIRIMEVPEQTTRIALLRTGKADVIQAAPGVKKDIEAAGFKTVTGTAGNLSVMYYMYENFNNNPFGDKRVREALSISIDRKAIVNRLYSGAGGPLSSFHSGPGTSGYDDKLPADPYDLAKARKLMADAGYPDGFKVRILVSTEQEDFPDLPIVAQAVLGYMQELKVTGEIQQMDFGAMKDQMTKYLNAACGEKKNFCTQETAANPAAAAQSPYTLFIRGDRSRYDSVRQSRTYQSTLGNSRPMIQHKEVDDALRAVEQSFDTTERNALYQKYNKIIRDNFYNAPLAYVDTVFGLSNRVADWKPIAGRSYPNNEWTLKLK
jgi:ABC-type transport system substrate-binding protein